MKLLLTMLHHSFLLKYTFGSSLKAWSVDDLYWGLSEESTLGEFQAVVEVAIELNCYNVLEKIPSMASAEKRVWYLAKYYDTLWEVSPRLFPSIEVFQNVHSVLIADNPEVLACFPDWVVNEVTKPVNLATYDAVNIARTLSDRLMFAQIDLRHFHATQIIKLQEQREAHSFDLAFAIRTMNLDLIQNYIDNGIWRPTVKHAYHACDSHGDEYVLFLLKNLKVPSACIIDFLISEHRSSALHCILLSNPDWKVRTRDVNVATTHGLVSTLEWYHSVCVDTPPPSLESLNEARTLRNFNSIECFLKRYYQGSLSSFNPGWKLDQDEIDTAAAQGFVYILTWYASIDLFMPLPSATAIRLACRHGHLNALQWNAAANPFWMLSPIDIDTAVIHGHLHILEWDISINKSRPAPHYTQLCSACARGHLKVLEWFLAHYYQDCLSMFQPFDWSLKQVEVDKAAAQGCIYVLKWNAAVNPTGFRPSADALAMSIRSGSVNVLEWAVKEYFPTAEVGFRASIFLLTLTQSSRSMEI